MKDLAGEWENFEHFNDRRLKEIEQQGSAQALTLEALNEANKAVSECQRKIDSGYA